jgi:hypothetical protein
MMNEVNDRMVVISTAQFDSFAEQDFSIKKGQTVGA